MKVALVHDTITEFGGAERVLQSLIRIFPDAHIYTAYIDKKIVAQHFPNISANNLHTSCIQTLHLSQYGYLFQFFAPIIWNSFDFEDYDVVISNSAAFMSNLIQTQKPVHIQYIQTPPKNIFNLVPQTKFQKINPIKTVVSYLYIRKLQSQAHILVNSANIQTLLKKITGVSTTILYPPVRIPKTLKRRQGRFFLIISRLTPEKRIDIAILACTKLKINLIIVGSSTDLHYGRYLRSIAGPSVTFLGFRTDQQIEELYQEATGFLFTPDAEDFGIAPLEALSHGVPVISYYGGGAKETMKQNKTGVFYYSQTPEALADVIKQFKPEDYDQRIMKEHALRYSEKHFEKELMLYIQKLVKKQ